jgi:hypothetical protein
MARFLVVIATATVLAALGVAPAGAGGWVVTTLDPIAPPPVAGQTLSIGYTILQHGQTPVSLRDTSVIVIAGDGTSTTFAGRPSGDAGHHVADVTFPTAGTFSWSINPSPFPRQPLGTIDVRAAVATPDAVPTVVIRETRWPAGVRMLVTAAAVIALLALGVQLMGARARRPADATRPEPLR